MKKETFKGCEIPKGFTLEKCEIAIDYGESRNSGNLCKGLHARGMCVECGGIPCYDCILRRGNLKALIEYASLLREQEGGQRDLRFKGYKIPRDVIIDDEKLRSIADRFNSADHCMGWCLGSDVSCEGIDCGDCLMCDNEGCAERKRAAFAAYLERRGIGVTRRGYGSAKSNMPELKPGMLAETGSTAKYILIIGVSEGGVTGHEILTDMLGVDVVLGEPVSMTRGFIRKLWWSGGIGLSLSNVRRILGGGTLPDSVSCWGGIRKMTVDEVSKALGFTVEIVGNEKADD